MTTTTDVDKVEEPASSNESSSPNSLPCYPANSAEAADADAVGAGDEVDEATAAEAAEGVEDGAAEDELTEATAADAPQAEGAEAETAEAEATEDEPAEAEGEATEDEAVGDEAAESTTAADEATGADVIEAEATELEAAAAEAMEAEAAETEAPEAETAEAEAVGAEPAEAEAAEVEATAAEAAEVEDAAAKALADEDSEAKPAEAKAVEAKAAEAGLVEAKPAEAKTAPEAAQVEDAAAEAVAPKAAADKAVAAEAEEFEAVQAGVVALPGSPAKSSANPLTSDPELRRALASHRQHIGASSYRGQRQYAKWKVQFLRIFETFLSESGMAPASRECDRLSDVLTRFLRDHAAVVLSHLADGALSATRRSVRALRALAEMDKGLRAIVGAARDLVPMTAALERERGHTKFHVGAVLIREGFGQYVALRAVEDELARIEGGLAGVVADGARAALFEGYRGTLRSFCDIMASLGLYDVMMTCAAIARLPPVKIRIAVENGRKDEDEGENENEDKDKDAVVLQLEFKDEMAMSLWALKERIAGDCGILPDRQVIRHRVRAATGDDDDTVAVVPWEDNEKLLEDYYGDIVGGDTKPHALHLSVEPFRFLITVLLTMMDNDNLDDANTSPTNVVHCRVDPTEPLSSLQQRLERASGIPAHNQHLFLRKIDADREGDAPEKAGLPLRTDDGDAITVEEHGIEADDVLELEPRALRLTLRLRNLARGDDDGVVTTATLSVTPSDDGDSIKGKLLVALLDPGTGQAANGRLTAGHLRLLRLERDGEEWPAKGNTVRAAGVKGGCYDIALEAKLPTLAVTVRNSKLLLLDGIADHGGIQIHPMDTLLDIKRLLDCGHHPVEQLRLYQNGKELAEEDADADANDAAATQAMTAVELGIQAGAVLTIEPATVPMSVRLRNDDGEDSTLAISVAPSDTAEEIKARIVEAGAFRAAHKPMMALTTDAEKWQGTVRDNFGVFSIDVTLPKLAVTVEAPMLNTGDDGENTVRPIHHREIQILPTDTILDIKRRLNYEQHPMEQLRLYHNGEELAEKDALTDANDTATAQAMTVAELGIEAGAVLTVEPTTIPISVRLRNDDGEDSTFIITVAPSDTAEEIKAQVVEASGNDIRAAHKPMMILTTDEDEWQGAVRDNYTANNGATRVPCIDVTLLKLTVTVQSHMLNTGNDDDNTVRTIQYDSTVTLDQLMGQLETLYGGRDRLSANHMALYLNDGPVELLHDNFQIGDDLGITRGSVLRVEPKTVTLHIRNNTLLDSTESTTATLTEVNPGDSTAALLQRVSKTGSKHYLVFGSQNISSNPQLLIKDVRGIRDGAHLSVERAKVRVSVKTPMHGGDDETTIKLLLDPPKDALGELKRLLEEESGEAAENQNLYLLGKELVDATDNTTAMTAADHGITAASVLTMEPRSITLHVTMPDGRNNAISVRPRDTLATVKHVIEAQSGVSTVRQVLSSGGDDASLVKDTKLRDGSDVHVTLHCIPITVKTINNSAVLHLNVEPSCTVDKVKEMIAKELDWSTNNRVVKPQQCSLAFEGTELMSGEDTLEDCGIVARSTLMTELLTDPIIFVDIKCGTLFAVDRELVIATGVLTLVAKTGDGINDNKVFVEAIKTDPEKRNMILKKMKDSSTLGVATHVVVTGVEVDDYKLNNEVSSMWGVKLKPRGKKDKKNEEVIFVDPITGATGELSREKCVKMNFITPVPASGKSPETIAEREKNTMKYEGYIAKIRKVFGVKYGDRNSIIQRPK